VQFAVEALKMGHKIRLPSSVVLVDCLLVEASPSLVSLCRIGKLLGMEPNAVGFGFGTQSKSIK